MPNSFSSYLHFPGSNGTKCSNRNNAEFKTLEEDKDRYKGKHKDTSKGQVPGAYEYRLYMQRTILSVFYRQLLDLLLSPYSRSIPPWRFANEITIREMNIPPRKNMTTLLQCGVKNARPTKAKTNFITRLIILYLGLPIPRRQKA